MPKRRPWTLDACKQAMVAWVVIKYEAQTQDAIDVAENIVFDMRTGDWTNEGNKRFHVAEAMCGWIQQAFHYYGYWLYAWSSRSDDCKPIKLSYTPLKEREELPGWLPISDIEHIVP